MFRRSTMAPFLALLALPLMAGLASAQGYDRGPPPGYDRGPRPDHDRGPPPPRDAWELLGEKSVGFGVDRDSIRLGRHEGRFSKIGFEVRDNDIQFIEATVFFEHGPPQPLPVKEFVRAGTRSRPIDLAWGDRTIDRIELVYRSRPGSRERAKVAVFGLRDFAPPPPPPPAAARWEELGCSKAGFLPDKDVIHVGRHEGRFRQIQLRVFRNRVHIINLRVIYGNGAPDDIPVRSEIRAGGESRPLDLAGGDRFIDRVELFYQAQPSFRGAAKVCIYGR